MNNNNQTPQKTNKPIGIYILGIALILYGVSGIAPPMPLGSDPSTSVDDAFGLLWQYGRIIAAIALGIGLLKFKELFRKATLVAIVIYTGWYLYVASIVLGSGSRNDLVLFYVIPSLLFSLATCVGAFIYLNKKSIKAYFK